MGAGRSGCHSVFDAVDLHVDRSSHSVEVSQLVLVSVPGHTSGEGEGQIGSGAVESLDREGVKGCKLVLGFTSRFGAGLDVWRVGVGRRSSPQLLGCAEIQVPQVLEELAAETFSARSRSSGSQPSSRSLRIVRTSSGVFVQITPNRALL